MRNLSFFLLLLLPLVALSQGPFLTEVEGQYETLTQRMAAHNVQGSAVIVIRDMQLDTALYMGYRDAEHQLAVDAQTRFQLGSMTGALVNFAVMRLVHEGKVELDAPANQYLRSWQIEPKRFTRNKPVTVRDLLLETRGFHPIYKPKGYVPGSKIPTWDQIMAGKSPSNLAPLSLQRNKAKRASLANDLILQRLLEDMHQQDFATLMQAQVFAPLGMTHSLIAAELSDAQKQQAAIGYEESGEAIEGGRWVYPELGHSGLWTTPLDFAQFVQHLYRAAKGRDNRFLSQDLAQAGITAQNDYAALILLQDETGKNYWGGAPRGFYCQFAGNVEEGWIVVGCANRQLAWQYVNWDLNARAIEYARR